ncbi:16S rRNA (guanine(527)-N(7))-methyltransferase RsmG [bacterium SCSIO 12643]|nr:16S rRNA (guanine(527)-N(7))-methyltransferase RsmG [bacterium SCSIO 12643]
MDGIEIIEKYFDNLTDHQKELFSALNDLYREWNEQINVISRKDIDELYTRHVLHSLAIAKFTSFPSGTQVLDVGCGGGFPGIPLAIMFPEAEFLMVDSIGKKIKVVKAVSESLGLENVKAIHGRAEKVQGKFNVVVSRAVTRMKPFRHWVHQKINAPRIEGVNNGILALKGGDLDEEMREIRSAYQEVNLNAYYEEDFFETKKLIFVPY